jgi:curved DNA-binding protein CbpA
MAERNPYEVLGVAREASQEEIRDAYRRLAKRYHPDRNAGDTEAEARFKEISAAHELLSHPSARERFDRGGDGAPSDGEYGRFYHGASDAADARMRHPMAMATLALLIIFAFGYFAESGMMDIWDEPNWPNSVAVLLLLCFSVTTLMAGFIRWILDRTERRAERAER